MRFFHITCILCNSVVSSFLQKQISLVERQAIGDRDLVARYFIRPSTTFCTNVSFEKPDYYFYESATS